MKKIITLLFICSLSTLMFSLTATANNYHKSGLQRWSVAIINSGENNSATYNIHGEKIYFSEELSFVNYLWMNTPKAEAGFKNVFEKLAATILKEEDFKIGTMLTNMPLLAKKTTAKTSSTFDFAAGAAVIDMGIIPQTVNNGLKPYGLIYALVANGIPVNWIINPDKSFVIASSKVDQIDLSVTGKTSRTGNILTGNKDLKAGPLLIAAEYMNVAGPIIEAWVTANPGLTVYWQLEAITAAPVFGVITSFPTTVIYPVGGDISSTAITDIEVGFYNRAGIPEASGAFRKGRPGDITECDQFYVLSHHTDPESNWIQEDVNDLYDFVIGGGNVWMGCHDVSISESLTTSGKSDPKLNFLSTTGLMPYAITGPTTIYTATPPTHTNSFANNDVGYTISSAPDPIMQFMGQIHSALNGNSERIYLPLLGGGWRPTTTIGFYARTHVDITAGKSPGQAAIMAYGPAYGNPAYGTVLYQGSHISEKNNGGAAEWVGEARLFGNYLLQSAIKTSKVAEAGLNQSSICGTNIFTLNANTLLEGSIGTWSIESGPSGGGEVFSDNNSPTSTFYSPNEGTYSLRWTIGTACASWDWDNVTIIVSNCSSLDFDGVDDYVNTGNNFAGNYSFEAWIRPKAASGTILSKRDSFNLGDGYELILNNNKPTFRWNGGSVSSLYNLSLNNRWYHIAVSFNGKQATMYIDGIFAGTNSGDALTNSASPFLIGASYNFGSKLTSNHFNGWIDEVRIWNEALTVNQVRFMMNQRLQDSANMGVEIPVPVPGNLLFNKLEGYYRLISANSDPENFVHFNPVLKPANGFTPNIVNINVPGRLHNMTTNQQNTAPVPYISRNDGLWACGNTTWLRPTVWDYPNSFGIDGTTKIDWNIVQMSHNITSGDNDITVLGLISTAGKLTIADPIVTTPIENNSGQSLRVTQYLELDGVIDLVGESQLLQDEGSILDQDSGGYVERDQQGTANSFNYNYWSSSVGLITPSGIGQRGNGTASTNASHKLSDVLKDGTNADSPGIISFGTPYTWADNAYTGAKRISAYWLYTFNGTSNTYSQWHSINEFTSLIAGEGYTMKGTSGAVTIASQQNYVFKGKPNNGEIKLPIAAGNDRLIGNPYASAMDADEFILDNLSGRHPSGNNIFNGALYFWDHFGQINTHILREYVGGYATYNLIGGAKAISNDIRVNNNNAIGTKIPRQYIPVGQGFFVITSLDASLTGIATVSGGDIVFKNSQRVFKTEALENSVFMKTANAKTASTQSENQTSEKKNKTDNSARIWLQFDSPTGYHRQLLVGVDENASNHFDLGYDAPIADLGKEDMFWTFDGSKFVIQGVNNFDKKQELPLGLKIFKAGLLSIKIDKSENLNKKTSVFIKDKLTGLTHQIDEMPFEINLEPGEYLNRFYLTFKKSKVKGEKDDDNDDDENHQKSNSLIAAGDFLIFMNNTTAQLQITKPIDAEIVTVNVYNYLGQAVKTWNTNLTDLEIYLPIKVSAGAYIVQINTKNGPVVQKVIVE